MGFKIVKRQQLLITSMRAFWQYQKQSMGFHGYGGLRHSQIQTKKKEEKNTIVNLSLYSILRKNLGNRVFQCEMCSTSKGKGRTVSGREHKLCF
jgi:hypothetical protein